MAQRSVTVSTWRSAPSLVSFSAEFVTKSGLLRAARERLIQRLFRPLLDRHLEASPLLGTNRRTSLAHLAIGRLPRTVIMATMVLRMLATQAGTHSQSHLRHHLPQPGSLQKCPQQMLQRLSSRRAGAEGGKRHDMRIESRYLLLLLPDEIAMAQIRTKLCFFVPVGSLIVLAHPSVL